MKKVAFFLPCSTIYVYWMHSINIRQTGIHTSHIQYNNNITVNKTRVHLKLFNLEKRHPCIFFVILTKMWTQAFFFLSAQLENVRKSWKKYC